ncbi:MAG: PAS domain S-box protein [Deltaproteobacteria bacterium]|nr:PAS domain S-box protein [Deltaproteobacteria bacterium]
MASDWPSLRVMPCSTMASTVICQPSTSFVPSLRQVSRMLWQSTHFDFVRARISSSPSAAAKWTDTRPIIASPRKKAVARIIFASSAICSCRVETRKQRYPARSSRRIGKLCPGIEVRARAGKWPDRAFIYSCHVEFRPFRNRCLDLDVENCSVPLDRRSVIDLVFIQRVLKNFNPETVVIQKPAAKCPNLLDLQELFASAPIGIFTSTPDGRFLTSNVANARMHGYDSPEELIAQVKDIANQLYADPADREKVKKLLETKGEVIEHECRMLKRDGSIVWVSGTTRAVRDENGNITHYQGFSSDITARKASEEALRKSEERFFLAMEATRDGLWDWNVETDEIYLSPNYAAILGYEPEEIPPNASSLIEFIHPKDWSTILGAFKDCSEGRCQSFSVELRMQVKTGGWLWGLCRGQAVAKDSRGRTTRMVGTYIDITAQKLALDALSQSEDKFRKIVNILPQLVCYLDRDMVFHFVNPAFERFFNIEPVNILGRTMADLVGPQTHLKIKDSLDAVLSGRLTCFSDVFSLSDGRESFFEGTLVPDLNGHGQVVGFYVVLNDVTHHRQIKLRLQESLQAAEAAGKAKNEFLANMSHELRTPLNGILGTMNVLKNTCLNDDQCHFVDLAIQSSDRLSQLLSDILDISRIEAGRLEIRDEPFDLLELNRAVFEIFELTARTKNLLLDCALDPSLPRTLVGDEARLRQILFNLVGNAVKYTPQGTVAVGIDRLTPAREGQERILLTVTDTGIGIPEDHLADIFEPFHQVDGSYTRRYQGAGLGLAIVRRLVGLMGGNMALESVPGLGTTVYVALPFTTVHRRTPDPARAKPAPVQALRILLTEDEPSNREPLARLLKNTGHTVAVANNGRQAVEMVGADDFDLVLMDIQMPVMNGVEATRAIRESEALGAKKDIPIIALTAYAMKGDRDKFLKIGMDDYVSKPVMIEELLRLLSHYPRRGR